MAYHLYPCTTAQQLFAAVLHSDEPAAFGQALQLDFAASRFSSPPRFLFQNAALGEWFKVRLAGHEGIVVGLQVGHSREVLEHYLGYFFPELVKDSVGPNRWVYPDIISLRIFSLLQRKQRSRFLPAALCETLELVAGHEAQTEHLWGFAQSIGQLFASYDSYRRELHPALEGAKSQEPSQTGPEETLYAEPWQRNLWHELQDGLCWHGALIEQVLERGLKPIKNVEIEPLYIVGSGFLSAQHLAFYSYISHFAPVCHFWLTPSRFPLELCRTAAAVFREQNSQTDWSELLGGLPQCLWLENSLHSAALLSREPNILWHDAPNPANETNATLLKARPDSLLHWVQQCLAQAFESSQNVFWQQVGDASDKHPKPSTQFLQDKSIRFFGCSGKHREVEVLKDQILAALDAHPDWQLNDIAVLAPDINEYQTLLSSVFASGSYRLNYNFIDLHGGVLSAYFSAFSLMLGFASGVPSRFPLDESLRFLENPCTRGAKILEARPASFWHRVFRYWKLSLDIEAETGSWSGALGSFLEDYQADYLDFAQWDSGHLGRSTASVRQMSKKMSMDHEDAMLIAELLQLVFTLHQCLSTMAQKKYSIGEWVSQLEGLLDEFLLCRPKSAGKGSDENDRQIIERSLRDLLALEKSLVDQALAASPAASAKSAKEGGEREFVRFPFVLMRSLLEQKLEQNFRFTGRYLTQGITCASLQPYRSVPFRMICVLGMNEGEFPRQRPSLRFDLAARLPGQLSKEAQEQHIFAELLISARQRLLLFYEETSEKNPSGCLHQLASFVAKIHTPKDKNVWEQLTEQHPLFPFDECYFSADSPLFSYNRSAYVQNLMLQNRDGPHQQGAEIGPQKPDENASFCQFSELLELVCDAPGLFWRHYTEGVSGKLGQFEELPLAEQFAQGDELLLHKAAPFSVAKLQAQLWTEPELLLHLLCSDERREFLRSEGYLGAALFEDAHAESLERGIQAIGNALQQKLDWSLWRDLLEKRQYTILASAEGKQSGRLVLPEDQRYGVWFLPALNTGRFLLEYELRRLWFFDQTLLCWNTSPFGFPVGLYNLLQRKLLIALLQGPHSVPEPQGLQLFGGNVGELLQVGWAYSEGLVGSKQEIGADKSEKESCTLEDYLWLLLRARCEPLPLHLDFLAMLQKDKGPLREALGQFSELDLCGLLQVQWQAYLQKLLQAEREPPNWGQFSNAGSSEAIWHLPLSFESETLQDRRFWLVLRELLDCL